MDSTSHSLKWSDLTDEQRTFSLKVLCIPENIWNKLSLKDKKILLHYLPYSSKQLFQKYLFFDEQTRRLKGITKSLSQNRDDYGHQDDHPFFAGLYEDIITG